MTRGETTPLSHARVDVEANRSSLALCKNFTTLKFGGARRRPGTIYAGSMRYADKEVRLIPFVFSETQAYMLEFGDFYMRLWAQAGGVYGVVLSSGSPYTITTPYPESAVSKIQWAGSFDTMYLAHPNHPVQILRRFGHTSWSIASAVFVDGPYMPISDTGVTVTSSAIGGVGTTRTLTWSNISAINNGVGFSANDVGRYVRFKGTVQWSWGQITSIVSTTKVNVLIKGGTGFTKTPLSTASWRLGSFSNATGFPSCVATFEGRLALARTNAEPRSTYLSYSGYPLSFIPSNAAGTVTDDMAAYFTLFSQRADEIMWLVDAARLQVGTASAIRSVGPTDSSLAVGPRNINQRVEVSAGTVAIQPTQVDQVTMFSGRYGKSLRDLVFDFTINSLVSSEVSLLSEHLIRAKMKWSAYQDEPDSTLWFGMEDGTLAGFTISRAEKVTGFHSHDLAGGQVISGATIPGVDRDELWVAVRRTINGQTKTYMEVLSKNFDLATMAKEDAFFVDCGATYSGSPTTTITGLAHLEGEAVKVLADGKVVGPYTVVGGSITLGASASKAHVGLAYESRLTSLRLPVNNDAGVLLGRKMRIAELGLYLYETLGIRVQGLGKREFSVLYRDPASPASSVPEPFSGIVWPKVEDSWDGSGQFSLVVDDPVPATVLAINVAAEVEEMS